VSWRSQGEHPLEPDLGILSPSSAWAPFSRLPPPRRIPNPLVNRHLPDEDVRHPLAPQIPNRSGDTERQGQLSLSLNDLEKPNVGFNNVPMVKLHEEGGYRVYVYSPPREHHPPHVHVECSRGGEVLIRLGARYSDPSLWQNHHMSPIDARNAVRLVRRHRDRFMKEWKRLHGESNTARSEEL